MHFFEADIAREVIGMNLTWQDHRPNSQSALSKLHQYWAVLAYFHSCLLRHESHAMSLLRPFSAMGTAAMDSVQF